jgi:hypothetical protein
VSIGQGALRITLDYPSGPFFRRYRGSVPRLTVDGVDQPGTVWGTQVIPVPAGPHKIRVLVRGQDGDAFGHAEATVTVDLAGQSAVVYKAPWFHGSRGRLKIAPGAG